MPSLILIGVIIFTLALFVYSLVSHRIEGSMVTAPMIFVAIGLLVSPDGLDIVPLSANSELVLVFAEIALVLILFSDAARIDFHKLKGNRNLPSRLLGIGLPLTIFFGAVVAILFFSDLSFPEAALIGVILAPTDAGLGQVIVNSPKVPARIRQALNVESGLNDGGAIPFFAFFLVLARAEENNIPAIGEENARLGRGKFWMNLISEVKGSYPDVEMRFIPMPCRKSKSSSTYCQL
jgi:NhaP-type Na+/H+ or K+/H+ antiporter